MTPEEFAEQVPVLYHVCEEGVKDSLRTHGLLTAVDTYRKSGKTEEQVSDFIRKKRKDAVSISMPDGHTIILGDNKPLRLDRLEGQLSKPWTAQHWLAELNSRIFFWPKEDQACNFRDSRFAAGRQRLIMKFDTLTLSQNYLNYLYIAPINTGQNSTATWPALGPDIFSRVSDYSYQEWRRLRRESGKKRTLDDIREISAKCSIPNIMDFYLGDIRE